MPRLDAPQLSADSLSAAYLARSKKVLAAGMGNALPLFVAKASGALVDDLDGNRFIDFGGGIGTLNVGHSRTEVIEAVVEQARAFLHTSYSAAMYPGYVDLAEKLVSIVPGEWQKKVMLQTTGAEAVENAIKIARKATGRSAIVAFQNAFHGRTYMALSLTAKGPAYKAGLGPFAPEIYRAQFPVLYRSGHASEQACADAAFRDFKRMIETEIDPGQVAAVIIEAVQGEGGFNVAPPSFLQNLREYCTRHGIVFIVDEIQTGFCRTGKWFATEHADVAADLYTLAKSLGGGMPIAAVVGRAELMDAPGPGGLGGTYGGNPVSCAAALAVIKIMEDDNYPERADRIGKIVRNRFLHLADLYPAVGDVRGLGAMLAFELVKPDGEPDADLANAVVRVAHGKGLLVLKAGFHGNAIRFLAPLCIEDNELEQGLDILEATLQELSGTGVR